MERGRKRRWLRLVWTLVLFGAGLLSWLGVPIPPDRELAMDWLTSLDVWLINTFQYPSIFMFVVALFIGTVAFPELWRLARRSYFEKPTANMLLLDAVSYIANKSAWGLRQPFMTSYVGAFGEARQNASKGDLMLWGLMENGGTEESPQFSTLEGPIEPQYWHENPSRLKMLCRVNTTLL